MAKQIKITFDEYFHDIYQERWSELKLALLQKHQQIIRPSFKNQAPVSQEQLFGLPVYTPELKGINQEKDEDNLSRYYIMDPASVICAKSLDIKPDDFVLDMCAAPGGKSLILLEQIESGSLWANEISRARRDKLKKVIQNYVPESFREKILIKGKDGGQYGLQYPDTFDKVLLDAPCSGERHLLNTPKELKTWNVKRTKRLSQSQFSLLCSALLSCKPGGQILYSTCSISTMENDDVIEKLLTKKGNLVELDLPSLSFEEIERTKFGYILLPDKSKAGPIYFSRLKKLTPN